MALLVLAAGVAVLGVLLTRHRDAAVVVSDQAFVCPMHLDVTSAVAGSCPICGMALVKARSLPREAAGRREDGASEDSIAVAQILAQAASGVAGNLVGYYPAALRDHFFRYDAYAPAWLESDADVAVLLYRDQLPALDPAEVLTFSPTARPETAVEIRLDPRPAEDWDASLSLVHFRLDARAAPALAVGTVGWVKLPARPRHMQVIPAGAVLESPDGPYVLVIDKDRRSAAKRPIRVGRTVTGLAAVVGGLALHEQAVSANAFFWDAERRLQPERRAASGGAGR